MIAMEPRKKKGITSAEERLARRITKQLEGWQVVAQYTGSNGSSVHTVESDGKNYRCTCQGFRIHKRGHCKHTTRAQEEGL